MDGQRRVAEQVRTNRHFRPDCPARYRFAARALAVLFVLATIVRGVVMGGHLDYAGSPWLKMPGQVAGLFGLAAFDIEMTGLQHHEPNEVLALISVKPGGPLIGFDAKKARDKLEQIDWIDTATVIRRFPNQLLISVVEREPFVVWQHDGTFEVVDRKGQPMSGVSASARNMLLLVVGVGANDAASGLVNQIEVTPGLMADLKAAVRVGGRRWDLHMQNGVVIALPEGGSEDAFRRAETAYFSGKAAGLMVERIDMRVRGEVAYRAAGLPASASVDTTVTSSIH